MDRDFILNVKAPQATRSFALCGQDGDGLAAVASFQPFFPGLQQPRPLNLAIVIDCSGSMQGDSMEQAKQALEGILDGLQPHDRITLIAFGNSTNVRSQIGRLRATRPTSRRPSGLPRRSTRTWAARRSATPCERPTRSLARRNLPTSFW
jgi:Ca-activated chloride channel family protein